MPTEFQTIPVGQIKPSRHQARKAFDEESIIGLAESIKEEGLQQPVTVRQVNGGYELISGERRLRAIKLLGETTILAHVMEVPSEASAAAKGLVENVQRQDLNPIEEAEGFKELNELDPAHWTQEQIGKVAGKPQSRISESIRLLTLPDVVLDDIRQRILTREHGVELLRINNAKEQKRLAAKVGKKGLSVKQLRVLIDRKLKPSLPARSLAGPSPREGEGDPLATVWSSVISNPEVALQGNLKIEYVGDQVWDFRIAIPGYTPRTDLCKWFEKMAEAVKDPETEAKELKEDQEQPFYIPATEEEFKRLEEAQKNDPEVMKALRALEEGDKFK